MIDAKKFVVAFLAIAILTGSSALIFSNTSARPPVLAKTPVAASPTLQNNAFLPPSAEQASDGTASAAADTSSIDPNNLTENVANSILNNVVAANPDGPRDNGDGTQVVTAPSVQAVLSGVNNSAAFSDIKIPDWDFEAAQITTRIATSPSNEDVALYGNALGSVLNTYFVKTNLQSMASGTTLDPQNLSSIASNVQGAMNGVSGLTVPKDLAAFHKGLIKLLVYEKNAAALVLNASDDPMKAMLVLQAENNKYQAAVQEFQGELQKVVQNKAFSSGLPPANLVSQTKDQNGALAFFNEIFGIPEAHAIFGIGDIVIDPGAIAQAVLNAAQDAWWHLQDTILQILKNTLISMLNKLVIKAIQNNGNPKFVQAWSGLAANAFNAAAGSAFRQIYYGGLCPNFKGEVVNWLGKVYPSAGVPFNNNSLNGTAATRCGLSATVPNVPAYYNDFNAGGFDGFGALLSPNNNIYGTFAQAYDSIGAVGSAQQTAATNKVLGGTGFKGNEYCINGSIPNPLCNDGSEPIVTTPGVSLGDMLNRNLNSTIDLIVNANDWAGLLTTVTMLLLQKLIAAGEAGLIGIIIPPAGSPPVTGGATCQALPDTISISTSTLLAYASFGAIGAVSNATWSIPGGNPSGGTGTSFSTSFSMPGVYTATAVVTDSNGSSTTTNCSITVN